MHAPTTAQLHRVITLIAGAFSVQLLSSLASSLALVVNEAQAARVTEYMEDLLHRKSVEVGSRIL